MELDMKETGNSLMELKRSMAKDILSMETLIQKVNILLLKISHKLNLIIIGVESYEGDWEEDLMHGEGTYTFTNGSKYTGQWIKGQRHGDGKIEYLDGSYYQGQWEKDQMHGNGIYLDNEKVEWEGIFVNNTFESKIQKKLQTERKVMVSISKERLNNSSFS